MILAQDYLLIKLRLNFLMEFLTDKGTPGNKKQSIFSHFIYLNIAE